MKIEPNLYVIITDDNSGTNPFTFVTAEERDAKFAEFCRENWDEDYHGPMPDDPYEAYETVSSGTRYAYIYDLSFEQHPLFMALVHLLKEVVGSETDSDGDIILPLERSSDLRARIMNALGQPILRKDIFHGSRVDRDDDDEPIVWQNQYRCDCGEEWSDEWSCQCNDRCPTCRTEIEPHTSTWIGPEGKEAEQLWNSATFETVGYPTQKEVA